MSPRPGTDILLTEPSPGGGGILDTGQCFMLGTAARGPTETPTRVQSLTQFEGRFGPRSGGVVAHNAVRAFLTEGGSNLWFLRLAGGGAVAATGTVGASGAALSVSANSPGTWGNTVKVGIVADISPLIAPLAATASKAKAAKAKATPASADVDIELEGEMPVGIAPMSGGTPLRVVVTDGAQVVERSRQILTVGDAVSWARGSDYVSITADPQNEENALAAVADVTLSGGTDGGAVTPQVIEDALDRFTYSMGFAQVVIPGATLASTHGAILAHCDKNRRFALLDLDDTDDATIAADANGLHGMIGSRFASALAPRIVYPGPVGGTTTLVPYSAVQAGIIARADGTTGNPNEAPAGSNGESLAARGIARDFDNDTRELLNDLGVTLPKMMRTGVMRTYGTRTAAGPLNPNWLWAPGSRTVLAMCHEFDMIAEEFVHRQIDGARRLFTRLEVALGGVCLDYFNLGALYGEEPEDAFSIDTVSVNTDETIARGEVHAIVRVRVSPPGEWVVIELQKTPITQTV